MKIAVLKSHSKSSGGLEKQAERITGELIRRGASVERVSMAPSRLPSLFRIEQFDRHCKRWLQNNPADIVLGLDRNRYQTHLRAGNGVHAAFLHTRRHSEGWFKEQLCRINPLHRKILAMEKCAFEHPGLRKIFANSYQVKNEILHHYNTDPGKIEVIHNGVEWHEMEEPFNDSLHHHSPHFELLFVGHGYQRKGLLPLLQALSLLRGRDIHLTVVGKDKNEAWFRQKAKGLNVTFCGAQASVIPFYQKADALIIPSFYDPFANVTVEALAMGLFVLSSKHNGGSEILTEENGLLFDMHPDSIAKTIERALKEKKSLKSAKARREGVRHLDFDRQLGKLVDSVLA